eukprot:scaffold120288_cov69-Phaeocystis_antarctica.AAC.4
MVPSKRCAQAWPCAAESPYSRLASDRSFGPLRPSWCMMPSTTCASASPCAAPSSSSRLHSAKWWSATTPPAATTACAYAEPPSAMRRSSRHSPTGTPRLSRPLSDSTIAHTFPSSFFDNISSKRR